MIFADQMRAIACLCTLSSSEEAILLRAANEVGFTETHFEAAIARMAAWSQYTRPSNIFRACTPSKAPPASFLVAACLWTEAHSWDARANNALREYGARVRGDRTSSGFPPFTYRLEETLDSWRQRVDTWFSGHTEPTGQW